MTFRRRIGIATVIVPPFVSDLFWCRIRSSSTISEARVWPQNLVLWRDLGKAFKSLREMWVAPSIEHIPFFPLSCLLCNYNTKFNYRMSFPSWNIWMPELSWCTSPSSCKCLEHLITLHTQAKYMQNQHFQGTWIMDSQEMISKPREQSWSL